MFSVSVDLLPIDIKAVDGQPGPIIRQIKQGVSRRELKKGFLADNPYCLYIVIKDSLAISLERVVTLPQNIYKPSQDLTETNCRGEPYRFSG